MARHDSIKFDWRGFGRDLRDMRKSADLGLREAARDAKIHHATWCRAEQGRPVTVPIYLRLCDWMAVEPGHYGE